MKRRCTILAAIITCALLLVGSNVIAAQEDDQSKASESAEQPSPVVDVQKSPDDPEGRRVGTPVDVVRDLDFSFPKRDYLLPRLLPQKWFKYKEDLYEKYGVKLGFSYQAIYQKASDTTPQGDDDVAAGWALLEGKWTAVNRGKDFEGSLVASLDWRHTFTDGRDPPNWGLSDVGSLWPTDFGYVEWDPWVPVAYWEQWFTKDRFVMRLGQQNVGQIYDFFRFKDLRVAFSGSPLNAPTTVMPFPGPGLGAAFELWPIKDSTLYVVGTVNDMNFKIEEWNWDDAVRDKDFFYGLEVGYNWARAPGDFDHLHLNLFYADKPAENPSQIFSSRESEPDFFQRIRMGLQGAGRKANGTVSGVRQLHLQHLQGRGLWRHVGPAFDDRRPGGAKAVWLAGRNRLGHVLESAWARPGRSLSRTI